MIFVVLLTQIKKGRKEMNAKFRETLQRWQQLEPEREKAKDRIQRKFMLEFNYNSNHIEGNTLTYGQTELLLLFGVVVGDAKMRDLEEMKAHNVGLKMVIEEAKSDFPLTETFIRQVHKILLREDYTVYRQLPGGVNTSYIVHAGCYKTRPNSVITPSGERFEYASPEETPALMTDLLGWYNEQVQRGVLNPVELACLFHYRYIRIHPFEDGNGRIARLMVNFILSRYGYPMVVVPTKTKAQYLDALGKCDAVVGKEPSQGAHATLSQIKPFVKYFEKLIMKEMLDDITIVSGKERREWWYNGQKVTFKNENMYRIVEAIISEPTISVSTLSEALAINRSAVQRYIKDMQEKGYLVRAGSNTKGGKWHITLTRV